MLFEKECKKECSSPPMLSGKSDTTIEDAEQLEREMIQELARVFSYIGFNCMFARELSVLPMKLDSREEEQAIAGEVEVQLRKDFEAKVN